MAIHGTLTQEAYEVIIGNDLLSLQLGIPTTATKDEVAIFLTTRDDFFTTGIRSLTQQETEDLFSWITSADGLLRVHAPSDGGGQLTNATLGNLTSVGGDLEIIAGIDGSEALPLTSVGGQLMVGLEYQRGTTLSYTVDYNIFSNLTFFGTYQGAAVLSSYFVVPSATETITLQNAVGTAGSLRVFAPNVETLNLPNLTIGVEVEGDSFTSLTAPQASYVRVEGNNFTDFTSPANSISFSVSSDNFESLILPNVTSLSLIIESEKNVLIDASPTRTYNSFYISAPITDISFLSNVTQVGGFGFSFYNTEIEDLSPIDRADFQFNQYVTPTFSDALSQSALEEHSYGLFGCLFNSDRDSKFRTAFFRDYSFYIALWDNAYPEGNPDCATTSTPITPADLNPDQFSFVSNTSLDPNTQVLSNTVTLEGFDDSLDVTLIGGINTTVSVNGGAFTETASVTSGDTLQIRTTSPNDYDVSTSIFVGVGGTNTIWIVSTAENQGPIVANPLEDFQVEVDDIVNIDITNVFTDPEDHDLTYKLEGAPKSLSLEDVDGVVSIKGTLTLDDIGAYNAHIIATDTENASAIDYFKFKVDINRDDIAEVVTRVDGINNDVNVVRNEVGVIEAEITEIKAELESGGNVDLSGIQEQLDNLQDQINFINNNVASALNNNVQRAQEATSQTCLLYTSPSPRDS